MDLTTPNDCECTDGWCSRCVPGAWLDEWLAVLEHDDGAGSDVEMDDTTTAYADATETGSLRLVDSAVAGWDVDGLA